MADNDAVPGIEVDVSHLILVVVGAHLRAEAADRPLGYELCERIRQWVAAHGDDLHDPMEPVVCSDVWYVNKKELQSRPTISIGGPGVNALAAYYAQKLDASMIEDDQIVVQLDPEFVDLRVCVWGVDHEQTRRALELFVDQKLDGFLRAAATQVEPRVD